MIASLIAHKKLLPSLVSVKRIV